MTNKEFKEKIDKEFEKDENFDLEKYLDGLSIEIEKQIHKWSHSDTIYVILNALINVCEKESQELSRHEKNYNKNDDGWNYIQNKLCKILDTLLES